MRRDAREQPLDRLRGRADILWGILDVVAGDRQIAMRAVNLDMRRIAFRRALDFPSGQEADACAARADLGVGFRKLDDLGRPRLQLASLDVSAGVEVYASEPVAIRENEADASEARDARAPARLLVGRPGLRIAVIASAARVRIDGRLGRLRRAGSMEIFPRDPVRNSAQLVERRGRRRIGERIENVDIRSEHAVLLSEGPR
ncbi:hypothetical protein [Methylosinus sp. LW3]|uniref:hypothetical protein n=1 Tax=Methylosinus sp. LW3 TaxID=107635 RepID=UPI0012F99938|nr:hypothetical protein [Methylosinus sp. LW3]